MANGLACLAGLLGVALRLGPRLPGLNLRPLLKATGRALAAAAVMGLLAWLGGLLLHLDAPHAFSRWALSLRLLPLVALCALTYGLLATWLGHPEARELAAKVRSKLGRGKP